MSAAQQYSFYVAHQDEFGNLIPLIGFDDESDFVGAAIAGAGQAIGGVAGAFAQKGKRKEAEANAKSARENRLATEAMAKAEIEKAKIAARTAAMGRPVGDSKRRTNPDGSPAKGMPKWLPWAIGGGVGLIALIVLIIFLVKRKKSK